MVGEEMNPSEMACNVANAISDGINALCALLEWNDAGAIEVPPFDGATLGETMDEHAAAIREILYGGRIVGAQPFIEEDLVRVLRLKELIVEWPSTGALSPEVTTLAEACVSAFCGGMSWRTLMAYPRP